MPPFDTRINRSLRARLQHAVQGRLPLPGVQLVSGAVAFAARLRRRRALKGAADTKTIVVGSQTFGGAGKTPVCLYLAKRLSGFTKLGVLVRPTGNCRGFEGRVTCVREARAAGDEATLLWQRLPSECELFVMQDLGQGQTYAARYVQCLIVDDGLRRSELGCDLSIVVVDNGASNSVFPMGPCREDDALLEQADIIWLNKVDEPAGRAPVAATVRSRYAPVELVNQMNDVRSLDSLRSRPVTIISGIGRPDSFYRTLKPYLNEVVRVFEYGDHETFKCPVAIKNNELFITTEKDLARLPVTACLWALRIDLVVEQWDPVLDQKLKALCS